MAYLWLHKHVLVLTTVAFVLYCYLLTNMVLFILIFIHIGNLLSVQNNCNTIILWMPFVVA